MPILCRNFSRHSSLGPGAIFLRSSSSSRGGGVGTKGAAAAAVVVVVLCGGATASLAGDGAEAAAGTALPSLTSVSDVDACSIAASDAAASPFDEHGVPMSAVDFQGTMEH